MSLARPKLPDNLELCALPLASMSEAPVQLLQLLEYRSERDVRGLHGQESGLQLIVILNQIYFIDLSSNEFVSNIFINPQSSGMDEKSAAKHHTHVSWSYSQQLLRSDTLIRPATA